MGARTTWFVRCGICLDFAMFQAYYNLHVNPHLRPKSILIRVLRHQWQVFGLRSGLSHWNKSTNGLIKYNNPKIHLLYSSMNPIRKWQRLYRKQTAGSSKVRYPGHHRRLIGQDLIHNNPDGPRTNHVQPYFWLLLSFLRKKVIFSIL